MSDPIYQVINARYQHYDRYLRRRQPRGGKQRRPIFIGSLRVPPNSSAPIKFRLSQLKAHQEQIEQHMRENNLFLIDPTGKQIRDPDLVFRAPVEQEKTKGEPVSSPVKPVLPVQPEKAWPEKTQSMLDDIKDPEKRSKAEAALRAGDGATAATIHREALVSEVPEHAEKGEKGPEPEPEGTDKDDEPDAPAAEPDEKDEEQPADTVEEETPSYDLSLIDLSVAKLDSALDDIEDVNHVKALLEAEKANKNRKSAVSMLEEYIAELEE